MKKNHSSGISGRCDCLSRSAYYLYRKLLSNPFVTGGVNLYLVVASGFSLVYHLFALLHLAFQRQLRSKKSAEKSSSKLQKANEGR